MTFVPGHELSALLMRETAHVLEEELPDLRYATALVGRGSDVLGFGTARSMDHDWGPRIVLVLRSDAHARYAEQILEAVERALPTHLAGVPVDQLPSRQRPDRPATHNNTAGRARPHGVTVRTLPDLLEDILGIRSVESLDAATWLSIPSQNLFEFTAGPVFRDDDGDLTQAREVLAFYPEQVWFLIMAAWWQRIAQLEAFVGRTQELDDGVGSRVITASIVRAAMHVALLQQRRYPPYAKWLGTALARTPQGPDLLALMDTALTGHDTAPAVVDLLTALGAAHDHLAVTEPVRAAPSGFFDRPYPVIWAEKFSDALHAQITDEHLLAMPYDIGSIDVISDSTLAVASRGFRSQLRQWWCADAP